MAIPWGKTLRDAAVGAYHSAVTALGRPVIESAAAVAAAEARAAALAESLDNPSYDEDFGYRQTGWTERDMAPVSHDLMLKMIRWMHVASPEITRAFEIRRDLVCSEGFVFKAESKNPAFAEAIQTALLEHWEDPQNRWKERGGERVLELSEFGEWTMPAFVNPIDGSVTLGYIAPENILRVIANPLDSEDLQFIELKEPVDWEVPYLDDQGRLRTRVERKQRFEIIRYSRYTRQLEGEVFHLSVNRLNGGTRGLSDARTAMDWADRMHQLSHSECDRWNMIKNFAWDVTIKGADEPAIAKVKKKRGRPPKAGSVIMHNDSETWEAKTPDMKAHDASIMFDFLLQKILGAMGIPRHWYFDAENVNKANAAEMGGPPFAAIRERQNIVCNYLHTIQMFALQRRANARGGLRVAVEGQIITVPESEWKFSVAAVDPDRRNHELMSKALNHVVDAFGKMVAWKHLSNREAATHIREYLSVFGFQLSEELPEGVDQVPGDTGDALRKGVTNIQNYLDTRRQEDKMLLQQVPKERGQTS